MVNRFSREARQVVVAALDEAHRRGDRRLGTEHLLLGLLGDPAGEPAAALGVDLPTARDALDTLDLAAMASVGVSIDALPPRAPATGSGSLPFTGGAKDVMRGCLHAAVHDRSRAIETRHLLLAVLDCAPAEPAVALLHALSIDPDTVRARLGEAA
jgi:ATP-dependent Clp protease ATP-binding subunit ClpA